MNSGIVSDLSGDHLHESSITPFSSNVEEIITVSEYHSQVSDYNLNQCIVTLLTAYNFLMFGLMLPPFYSLKKNNNQRFCFFCLLLTLLTNNNELTLTFELYFHMLAPSICSLPISHTIFCYNFYS